jgi:hypothetical protein
VRVATRLVLCSVAFCPLRQGGSSSFYRPERENHMRVVLFSYVRERDVLCCRVGGRPDDPCSDPVIMAYLVPEQWRPRG